MTDLTDDMYLPLAVTISETGMVEREHYDGFSFPGELTFDSVNNFVHHPETVFEELQWLCLGIACELDKARKANIDAEGVCGNDADEELADKFRKAEGEA